MLHFNNFPLSTQNYCLKCRVEKVGSMGSMLPEISRFYPGTHKVRTYLNVFWAWFITLSSLIVCVKDSICHLYLIKSIVLYSDISWLENNAFILLNNWRNKCNFSINDSGTGTSAIFTAGTPHNFFQLCWNGETRMSYYYMQKIQSGKTILRIRRRNCIKYLSQNGEF